MHKPGDVVFAKVEGWSPWPARIMCEVSSHLYKVFFYGTRQESLVKFDWIWSSQDNMETFSRKYGKKKDYFLALQEMKKTPDLFTVDDNDFCSHKCMTCDQKRMNKKVEVESNPQMNESSDVDSCNNSVFASMKSVKVVNKKTIKSVSEKEPKYKTVETIKKPKEMIKLDSRFSRGNVVKVNKKWIDKDFNAEQVIKHNNIAMMENRESTGIKINETVDKLKPKLNTKIDTNLPTKTHFKKTTPNISKSFLKYKQKRTMLRLVQSQKSVKDNPKREEIEKRTRKYHVKTKVMGLCPMKNKVSFEAESENVDKYQETLFGVEMLKKDETLTQLKVNHNSNAKIESFSQTDARNEVAMPTLTNKESKSIVNKTPKNTSKSILSKEAINTQSMKNESLKKKQQNDKKLDMENSITEIWLTENPDQIEKEKMSLIDSDKIIDNIIYGDDDALDLNVSYDMFDMLDISQEDHEDKSQKGQNAGTVDWFDMMDISQDNEDKSEEELNLGIKKDGMKHDPKNDSCGSGSVVTDGLDNQQKGSAPVSFPTPKLGFFSWGNN